MSVDSEVFSFETDKLEEVCGAISQWRMTKLAESKAQLTIVSRRDQPSNIKSLIRELQYLIRARYGTRAIVVGGGYGCYRYIFQILGEPEDIEKTLLGLKGQDKMLISVLNKARVDFVEDRTSGQRTNIETRPDVPSDEEKIQEIIGRIPALKKELQLKFSHLPEQKPNVKDFLACLDQLVKALGASPIGDMSADKKFKFLGQLLASANPEAFKVVDELIGSVEFLAVIRAGH